MAEINNSRLSALIQCPHCGYSRTGPISRQRPGSTLRCPRKNCRKEFVYHLKFKFDDHLYHDISPQAFTHPLDRNAIEALRRVPGIDFVIRKMMEFGYEKIYRVNLMANAVKVTTKTCSYIFDMCQQAAKCLGVQMPEVYISQNPNPNAFTIGTEYPLITIYSSLIELLNENELYTVIAHEMGHIKCHHVLYSMLAHFLRNALGVLGVSGNLLLPLSMAMAEWIRKAELTADRAALLVSNNKHTSVSVLMKLSCGSKSIAELIDPEDFIHQAIQFEEQTKKLGFSKFYRIKTNLWQTHPFTVLRAKEIHAWSDSEQYRDIRNGTYERREQKEPPGENSDSVSCPHCQHFMWQESAFCEKCGHPIGKLSNQYDASGFEEFKTSIREAYQRFMGGFKTEEQDPNPPETATKVCLTCGEIFPDTELMRCPKDGDMLI